MPLSGNALKLIAAISMTLDHIGVILFPKIFVFRILGRLAFPIFAFFIAEGCRYTKNRMRYLATLAGMAAVFQIVYYVVTKSLYMSIFVTFSLSVSLIYLLDEWKKSLLNEQTKTWQRLLLAGAFLLALVATYLLNYFFLIDYGFWGCATPLFASLFHGTGEKLAFLDRLPCRLLAMALPLLGLAFFNPTLSVQWCGLFALPLLLLYSGKRGRYKMKYFFYIFYPAHLVLLYAISYLL